jgi:hypothetical protein
MTSSPFEKGRVRRIWVGETKIIKKKVAEADSLGNTFF